MPTVTATFQDRPAADRAVHDLLAAGIVPDNISLVVSNSTRERFFQGQDGGMESKAAQGAAIGGGVGAGLGAIAGGLVLGGVLTAVTGGAALPFLVAGPLAAAISGAIGGTAVGTVVGGITGAGLSEPVAQNIDEGIRQGALVVAVNADDAAVPRVEAILKKNAETIVPVGETPVPPQPGPGREPGREI